VSGHGAAAVATAQDAGEQVSLRPRADTAAGSYDALRLIPGILVYEGFVPAGVEFTVVGDKAEVDRAGEETGELARGDGATDEGGYALGDLIGGQAVADIEAVGEPDGGGVMIGAQYTSGRFVPQGRAAEPVAAGGFQGPGVSDVLAGDFALEGGEGGGHPEQSAAHGTGGVELRF